MIVIEVFAPVLGKLYDFKIHEYAPAGDIKEEICVMICQKEQLPLAENMDELMLFSLDSNRMLNDEISCYDNNVKNGGRLIIV